MRIRSILSLCVLGTAPLAAQQQAVVPATSSAPAAARSGTSRLFFTAAANGSAINFDGSSTTESGSGASLGVGYGFTPSFAGYIQATGAQINSDNGDYTLAHFDVGARFHFANVARAWIPFLELALSGRAVRQNDLTVCGSSCVTSDLSMSGSGLTFGGGVMYYASPGFAISADLKWTAGKFTHAEYGGSSSDNLDQKATSSRFGLGVVWFPMSR